MKERRCRVCGKLFPPGKGRRYYCSTECAILANRASSASRYRESSAYREHRHNYYASRAAEAAKFFPGVPFNKASKCITMISLIRKGRVLRG